MRIKEQNDKGHFHITTQNMHLPGGTVVKNLPCNAGGVRSIHGWGTKIPHTLWCSQNLKKKKYCKMFDGGFLRQPQSQASINVEV